MALAPRDSEFCRALVDALGLPWDDLRHLTLTLEPDVVTIEALYYLREPLPDKIEGIKKYKLVFEETLE